jgi:F-type H+-transporting ATPase subunit a
MAIDPIHQFEIRELFPIVKIGNTEIAFTNSAAYMFVAVAVIVAFLIGGTIRRSLVPGPVQSVVELTYEFVANTIRSTAGSEGMRFFPFVFTLFMFILTVNIIGLIPYNFTVTTHIIITSTLALSVFLTVLVYGFWKHGLHFFNLFVPKGIPIYILPLVTFIEVLSFLSRPISHSVRLFANMLAGHITLQVFSSFIILLGSAGIPRDRWRHPAIGDGGCAICTGAAGRFSTGLRFRHSHLHLSQRCHSSGPLRPRPLPLNCPSLAEINSSSNVRFGSKADMCSAQAHVRFAPNSDIDCVFRHVCFGPRADAATISLAYRIPN